MINFYEDRGANENAAFPMYFRQVFVESFAFFGGFMLLALATNSVVITNGLALLLLAARLGQSITHLLSTSVLAVQVRFVFFILQVAICFDWVVLLAAKFIMHYLQ